MTEDEDTIDMSLDERRRCAALGMAIDARNGIEAPTTTVERASAFEVYLRDGKRQESDDIEVGIPDPFDGTDLEGIEESMRRGHPTSAALAAAADDITHVSHHQI